MARKETPKTELSAMRPIAILLNVCVEKIRVYSPSTASLTSVVEKIQVVDTATTSFGTVKQA
jgi:hypothetical protein